MALIAHQSMQWLKESLPGCYAALKVRSYADATLTIEAADASSALEVQQASEGLLTYLSEECGHDRIKAIRLVPTF
ncbi:MAG: DciA family protein [Candidatus Peribacteraceae bacterium]|nr:DciA family protein [Candidatus Peribacteraceae bacterium]